jgi:predicted metal-binding membrane protein
MAGVSAGRAPVPLARQRNTILGGLLVLAVAGWVVVAWQAGGDRMRMHNQGAMAGLDLTMGMTAPLFFAMWVAMMVAMMFPAAAPMILLFDRMQARKREAGRASVPTAYFVGAYLSIWVAFGAVAYGLAIGVQHLADNSMWVMDNWARVGGLLLVAAGLYQLSPLKNVCLAKCRSPISFLMTSWRDGTSGAIRMGLHHGMICLGCCWLLFVILVPLGVMNVAAMAVIALIVFAEKCLPGGHRIAHVAAVVLVVYGFVVVVTPSALPTTVG